MMPHDHGGLFETCPEKIPPDADFTVAADIFRQLDDATRIKLFWLLCHCEECVVNLSAIMGMSSPAVSHHLRLLRAAGLVVTRRVGREVYYRAADTPTCQCLHLAIEKIMQINCPQ